MCCVTVVCTRAKKEAAAASFVATWFFTACMSVIATPCVRDRGDSHVQRLRVGDRQRLESLRGPVDGENGVIARELSQRRLHAEIERRLSPLPALAHKLGDTSL